MDSSGNVGTTGLGRAPTADDDSDLAPGRMVGEYQIEGVLGEGGMGRVYAAVHPVIAKRAAVKVLHPTLSVNKEAVQRFIQEARSVNQIGHPNIVDIFAFGVLPDGRNYFVMELLKGESLRDRIRRAPLPLGTAIAILDTITLALEAAHEKGIVHRDLKPDNVFLVDVKGDRPTVKLLDFGIAKLLVAQGMERTQTGNLLGTPAYISPEQARAQNVDHRTDIYALGAVMFEIFAGRHVFAAESAADMIAKQLYEQPVMVTELNPDVPAQVAELIAHMFAKEAAQRPTLAAVREVLRATTVRPTAMSRVYQVVSDPHGAATPHGSHTPNQRPPATALAGTTMSTRSRAPIIVVSSLVAALAGVGVFVAVGGSSKPAAQEPKPAPAVTQPPIEKPAEPPVEKPTAPPVEKPTAPPVEKLPDPVPANGSADVPRPPPVEKKPPRKKPPRKPQGPAVPVDPDAPA